MSRNVSDSASDELGSELLTVLAGLNRWATARADLPVPYAQARLLSLIDLHGPARISELAAADHSSQPTITQQLRRLDDAGLICRTPDPDDARAVQISLSGSGVIALRSIRQARTDVVAPELAAMSALERRRIAAAVPALRRLLNSLGAPQSETPATEVRSDQESSTE